MGGGLMQLVAYGVQDIYLTGNPQITFFKIVYRRYTNFAIETIEHQFVGTPGFGRRVSAKITRSGDLISRVYVRIKIEHVNPHGARFAWVKRLGHAIIKYVDIEIGGTKIDKQYGTWLDIWYELARQGDHEKGYAKMIGNVPELTNYNRKIKPEYILYIPLQFWFNRYVGLAIPLIALQYHETIINIEFEEARKLIIHDCKFDHVHIKMKDATLLVNYIYLDTEERRRFALVGHEYLIEQLQFNGTQDVKFDEYKYILDFNFPTKELIWAVRNGNFSSGKRFIYYTGKKWDIIKGCKLIIEKSISVGINPTHIVGGKWIEVPGNEVQIVSTFCVTNNNDNSIFINPKSLIIDGYCLTNKIFADITIDKEGEICISNIATTLTIRDFSIPLEYFKDTRYKPCDPEIHMFSNYGILINGKGNPIRSALLQFNGHDRFDTREGEYFNYVQPQQYHTNTPKDGINCYSFSLYPEEHQPSGTANLSRIETTTLSLSFHHSINDEPTFRCPPKHCSQSNKFNLDNFSHIQYSNKWKNLKNFSLDTDSDNEDELDYYNSGFANCILPTKNCKKYHHEYHHDCDNTSQEDSESNCSPSHHDHENNDDEKDNRCRSKHMYKYPPLHYFNEHNKLYIFGVNYNILRIYSGMGGIAYVAY